MTGFGKGAFFYENKNYRIEMRSLNSKGLDCNLRIPSIYKSKDMEIRKILSERVIRGKVDFYLQLDKQGATKEYSINLSLVKAYEEELRAIEPDVSSDKLLEICMRLPEVLSSEEEELSEEEWVAFLKGLEDALTLFNDFRVSEGKSLEEDFIFQINSIDNLLLEVEPFLEERNEKLKSKLHQALENSGVDFDEQRFHQELMYYIERWDVSEEKVRLKQHLEYFIETLQNAEESKGKLLGFICQEIGREINTLGSKANHSDIQKIVVQMKDSLEKIKEQVYNVL